MSLVPRIPRFAESVTKLVDKGRPGVRGGLGGTQDINASLCHRGRPGKHGTIVPARDCGMGK